MAKKPSDSILRAVFGDITRYVALLLGSLGLVFGLIWLLLSLHWVLAAQIVLVVAIVLAILLGGVFPSAGKS